MCHVIMKPQILPLQVDDEFFIEEQCYIVEQLNHPDNPELSIARARVRPGVTTRWHKLNDTSEHYYILSGQGRVEIGDLAPTDIFAGAVVVIPPDCRQRICNTGKEDLIFLAICTPRFTPAQYQECL
jgi:mannose-6-phosphate isomerase-like protein (cupin superfamily)